MATARCLVTWARVEAWLPEAADEAPDGRSPPNELDRRPTLGLGLGAIPPQVPGIDDTDPTMCQARPVPDDEDNAGRQQSQGANDEPAQAPTMKSV